MRMTTTIREIKQEINAQKSSVLGGSILVKSFGFVCVNPVTIST